MFVQGDMSPELQHLTSTTNTTGAAVGGGGLQQWKTPIPYLFGGLALMLGLIAVALIFLACSYTNDDVTESSDKKSQKPMHDLRPEMEPKVVVIMAGETDPTHIAEPIRPAAPRREEEV